MTWYEILIAVAAALVVVGVVGNAIYKRVTGKGGGCSDCSSCGKCSGCSHCSHNQQSQQIKK